MTDLSETIAPKSDQLNSDDLIGRTMTIKVTGVVACPEPEQPIAISFEGDGGKPYKPGKSMRRVLVQVWGKEGAEYVGRSMTIFRDPNVVYGGLAVGGIRISHMSHIKRPVTMALTASRSNRKAFTVQPLVVAGEEVAPAVKQTPLLVQAEEAAGRGTADYQAFWLGLTKDQQARLLPSHPELKERARLRDEEGGDDFLSGGPENDERDFMERPG